MTILAGTAGPSVYWYLTRSTGWVALLLLTITMILGVIDVSRWSSASWPRFVLDSLHRNTSLLVLIFLVIHIATAALDSFAPIAVVDAVLPFVGSYRPIWVGLGAVAFDLLLALAITSVMRQRLGHRAWRSIHWLAYVCWPIALLHGLGTGSDVKSAWSLMLTAICVLAVIAAVGVRALRGWPAHSLVRGTALTVTALAAIALIVWLPGGPLGHGWARRSGTPVSLLRSSTSVTSSSLDGPTSGQARTPSSQSGSLSGSFQASLSGTIKQGPGPEPGSIAVRIATRFSGTVAGRLTIEIDGPRVGQEGVSLRGSRVTLGSLPPAIPVLYHGRIVALNGSRLLASVQSGGHSLSLQVDLAINTVAGTVSGTLAASPTATGGGR